MLTKPDENLLNKFLENKCTPGEARDVLEWMSTPEGRLAAENRFDKDSAFLQNPGKNFPAEPVRSIQVFQQIIQNIGANRNTGAIVRLPFVPWLKIAAVFVVGFGISWFMQNLTHRSANKPEQALYQKIEVPYGSKTRLELPDGTRVTLNSGSTLKYPVQFGDKQRDVYLAGEAYFDVKKDASKPFYVNTSGVHIKVLGTSFNVKAYPEEETIETTLITGSVQIYSDKGLKNNTKPFLLKPNQKAIYVKAGGGYYTDKPQATRQNSLAKVDTFRIQYEEKPQINTSWKDNRLEFDNELFADLIVKLERWYNVDIEMKNKSLLQARFSGKFDKENIEQALKALVEVTPFHYTIEKNKILIQ